MTRRPEGSRRPAPTLRDLSVSTVLLLVAMIAAVGAVALAVTQYQGAGFRRTMADLQQGSAAMSELDRSMIEAVGPMIEVLYRPDGALELPVDVVAYDRARARIVASFDAAARALAGTAAAAPLASARATWESVDATVTASPRDWPTEELYASFVQRVDPWLPTVWEQLDTMDVQLADTRAALVGEMAQRSEEMGRLQQLLGPSVLGAIVVAIGLALLTVRRMSRRVLSPLAEVGHAAHRIHDTDDVSEVRVPGAVAEVQDLARIVNESAATLRAQHALLKQKARTDPMTELPNRDALSEVLEAMLGGPDPRVAVLFIDLDDFKYVNDTLGHAAGDAVLREVAARLVGATRNCEVVARLGGDEFAVGLDTSDDPAGPAAVAERIHLALGRPVDVGGHQVELGCSIGIATAEPHSTDVDGLLGCADFAMYMAKSQGKGRSEVYSATMRTEMSARMELGRELGVALSEGQLVLHYQPLLSLPSQRLLGFEALLRWQHPSRGLLSPEAFLGLAEESGAIVDIGTWVLERACATLAEHRRHHPELLMGVNVAPRQLADPGFAAAVVRCIEAHRVPASHLVLEITEATAMTATAEVAATLSELRDLGVHVALDDFGAGFSSLRYLGELPADVIKIDRCFIDSTGGHCESTLAGIVELAQRLGLRVVAEGVETEGDLDRLRGFDGIAGQGYLFGHPMAAPDVQAYLAERRTGAPS
jgi:diguanylate cyclase (GGDEF)-like protein